ncbi:MAG: redoxin domain-containing protein [Planctomycetaceae bacterium]|nr:redoxin domain-containing protein [Planctomycetaceae bacterium]
MRFAFALALLAITAPSFAASPLDVADPGKRAQLKSIYSGVHDLSQFVGDDTRAIVLAFLGTECPVARQYLPRLAQMHADLGKQGVQFLGIYSNTGVSAFDMAMHALDEDIPYPVFIDVDHRLADLLSVKVTPEVVVLDRKLERHYQGAIDNQFQRGGRRPAASENYLADALGALLAGKSAERSYVPASGCPLEHQAPQRFVRAVTYHKDVAPLVQQHCQKCHRTGGVAPFELTSFDDVSSNAEKIREMVSDRRMPPWHGVLDPAFGTLANDQRLADEEVETILAWIADGAPEGNPRDAPPPRRWPAASEWAIGKPDYVYRMPQPFRVPQTGALEYQFFRVRLDLPQDRWFRAVEMKPGNAAVVHHMGMHLAPATKPDRNEGLAMMAQLYGLSGESAQLINDFLPGDTYNAKVYPPGQAVLIPKHTDLIFEVHYTPNGKSGQTDQSMVAFQWADKPQHQVQTRVFRKPVGGFRVPPHNPHFRVEDTFYFPHDIEIDAIRPHFHLRGKSFRLQIIERDPQTDEIRERRTVLSVPIYDPAWQRTYELARPLHLPAGTELLATGHFDNSNLNPNNPDPTVEVVWGQQTTDEMFSTRFKYRIVKQ